MGVKGFGFGGLCAGDSLFELGVSQCWLVSSVAEIHFTGEHESEIQLKPHNRISLTPKSFRLPE